MASAFHTRALQYMAAQRKLGKKVDYSRAWKVVTSTPSKAAEVQAAARAETARVRGAYAPEGVPIPTSRGRERLQTQQAKISLKGRDALFPSRDVSPTSALREGFTSQQVSEDVEKLARDVNRRAVLATFKKQGIISGITPEGDIWYKEVKKDGSVYDGTVRRPSTVGKSVDTDIRSAPSVDSVQADKKITYTLEEFKVPKTLKLKQWLEVKREKFKKEDATFGALGVSAVLFTQGMIEVPITSTYQLVRHPVQSAKGLVHAVTHPLETGAKFGEQLRLEPEYTAGGITSTYVAPKLLFWGKKKITQQYVKLGAKAVPEEQVFSRQVLVEKQRFPTSATPTEALAKFRKGTKKVEVVKDLNPQQYAKYLDKKGEIVLLENMPQPQKGVLGLYRRYMDKTVKPDIRIYKVPSRTKKQTLSTYSHELIHHKFAKSKVWTSLEDYGTPRVQKAIENIEEFIAYRYESPYTKYPVKATKKVTVVTHGTPSGSAFKSKVPVKAGSAGRRLLEDPGLYVTPKGEGSPHFLGIVDDAVEYTWNPFKKGGKPAVVEVQTKGVVRYPTSVIKKGGFESAAKYSQSRASKGKAFITKRFELGHTRETEAIIPVGSELARQPQKGFIAKFKGYGKYTTYKGEAVPIKEYFVGEGTVSPTQFRKVATQIKKTAASSSRYYSQPTYRSPYTPLAVGSSILTSSVSRKPSVPTSTPSYSPMRVSRRQPSSRGRRVSRVSRIVPRTSKPRYIPPPYRRSRIIPRRTSRISTTYRGTSPYPPPVTPVPVYPSVITTTTRTPTPKKTFKTFDLPKMADKGTKLQRFSQPYQNPGSLLGIMLGLEGKMSKKKRRKQRYTGVGIRSMPKRRIFKVI